MFAPPMQQRHPVRRLAQLLLATSMALALAACGGDDDDVTEVPGQPETPETPQISSASAELALLATTDLHANVLGYDYFKLAEDPSYGFDRTATLIRTVREEFANTLLVDNGDTIQGTALADYEALVAPLPCGQQLSIYKAMAELQYDVGTLGNHEFNYGLPFLNQVLGGGLEVDGVDAGQRCAGAGFPMALANVSSVKTGKPLIAPYVIVERDITAVQDDGQSVTLPIKIGFVGLTTPGIMNWDKRYLDGKVTVQDGLEAAQQYVPEVRAQGADLVFVLLHGGMSDGSYNAGSENPGWHIAREVDGIDGLVMGHQHNSFPDRSSNPQYAYEGVDHAAGTVHGVPAVMPSSWGKALGVMAYSLQWDGQQWRVDDARTEVELRTILTGQDAGGANQYVQPDAAVSASVQTQHEATIEYVKTPIGTTDFRMSTLFADVGDPGAIQLVNQAQQDYVSRYVSENLPEHAGVPVLSISAPFKAGYQSGQDYTDVAAGPLAIFNAADLYLYPNTVYAVKVNGDELKLWLENAALRFNRIDPASTADQWLIKDVSTGQVPAGESAFAGYNFDMFTSADIQYEIDVTQPTGSRIRNLQYQGLPVVASQSFIVATNNYRAESSARYILGEGKAFDIIFASPDANRDVVINYIKEHPGITRAANGAARSWRFTPVQTAGKVLFKSGRDALAVAQDAGLGQVALDSADDGSSQGRAVYRIDLSQ
ncbi:bifunctional 2',3'-cyclic-nucleotide 2'-phosphodiesterase/3'-nucleotidase [Corticibacter populi]|uniref:Bifunctional 2',3'-cyclic-nucleotide 2'-phosphodiesterase/3'-nucleotidase n=1 Tax=Corticibacter populi TaxID=1550736 RepID=A0A3M6QXS9_9BURK|nr:bifunctional 2',3'-cyclic-nucleotide 2'-phosphodiesterase/3'-nucleotidase [Corticibacter populi]RMX07825.1 bifunctional 2',3'-cyclic-nucleotide 2'-phosphodiesterase/3'-nucleotidase [Corticibacter populi]RZS35059.1 2',3'-cyclic-nucleotide 2'-phosphodiesterase/3'-nucleotidase [Corticibacter populi]